MFIECQVLTLWSPLCSLSTLCFLSLDLTQSSYCPILQMVTQRLRKVKLTAPKGSAAASKSFPSLWVKVLGVCLSEVPILITYCQIRFYSAAMFFCETHKSLTLKRLILRKDLILKLWVRVKLSASKNCTQKLPTHWWFFHQVNLP